MSETMRLVFTVSAAVFEMFITMIFCDTVLKTRKDFISKALYILLCTVISAAFWFIRISGENWIFNLAVSSVQILLFTLLFETEWIRRFFAVISYLVFSMISEVIANSAILFTDSLHNVTKSSESYVYTVMLSKLIKFVLILIVMLIVQKDSLKTNFKDYLCLIIVPFISILIITVIILASIAKYAKDFEKKFCMSRRTTKACCRTVRRTTQTDGIYSERYCTFCNRGKCTIGSDGKTVHSGLAENTAVCGILVINFIVYYLLNNIIRANEIRQKQVQMEKQFQFQEQKYQQASLSFKSISLFCMIPISI
jgi:membrane protein